MITTTTKSLVLSLLLLTLTFSFASASELPINWHKQESSLSCEIAALKMALSYYGASVSETELIQNLNFDLTPHANGIWGDPNIGFVGNIKGSMLKSGYGVYWEPIAKLGSEYRKAQSQQFNDARSLAWEIFNNRPVVLWGYFGSGRHVPWQTPTGKTIIGINSEHARTVVGFEGPLEAPTAFILLDPISGRIKWSAEMLMKNSAPFDHFGVVVYPDSRFVKLSTDPTVWQITEDGKTRQALAISWEKFLSIGGHDQAIRIISNEELNQFVLGAEIN